LDLLVALSHDASVVQFLVSGRPVTKLHSALVALVGAVAYFALLWLLYARAPYAVIPHWWRHLVPNATAALVTWFTLQNVGGAILAAIPVALGVVLGTKTRRVALGLVVGVLPALYIVVGGLMEYGVPPSVVGWVVDTGQFLAVSLAVVAVVALIQVCLPNNRLRANRGSRLR
jgi:ethanolamine transporter EutH